ncbi:peroxiredoxin [Desulfovibrio inopinatus]|uniref:peroxiredoxin n=1 Tax=Desulfovibrio inopinatus TaxID=102109 RepID=UPI0003FB7E3D|nr:peroxiredoxin [Desulfovibrio inopinatus]
MSETSFPESGQPAPEFCLPDASENMVCLSYFKGKFVVVYFYPRDNTTGCTTEALEFTALADEFAKHNAVVLGISKDSAKSHRSFIEKHQLGITLLSDPEKTVLMAYGAWRLKKMYGKESMGVVRSTVLVGPDGNVVEAWPKVAKSAGHAAKVVDALKKHIS